MNDFAFETLRTVEEAVGRLLAACDKPGPVYTLCPRAVAQVNRTARWLLNAIASLHRELKKPVVVEDKPRSTR